MAPQPSIPARFAVAPLAATLALLCAGGVEAQPAASGTSLTIYSTTAPGAVPAELYRPLPGQGNIYNGQSVPGYAMVRQQHEFALERGTTLHLGLALGGFCSFGVFLGFLLGRLGCRRCSFSRLGLCLFFSRLAEALGFLAALFG